MSPSCASEGVAVADPPKTPFYKLLLRWPSRSRAAGVLLSCLLLLGHHHVTLLKFTTTTITGSGVLGMPYQVSVAVERLGDEGREQTLEHCLQHFTGQRFAQLVIRDTVISRPRSLVNETSSSFSIDGCFNSMASASSRPFASVTLIPSRCSPQELDHRHLAVALQSKVQEGANNAHR